MILMEALMSRYKPRPRTKAEQLVRNLTKRPQAIRVEQEKELRRQARVAKPAVKKGA